MKFTPLWPIFFIILSFNLKGESNEQQLPPKLSEETTKSKIDLNIFKSQSKSLINWIYIDPIDWLDLDSWKRKIKYQEVLPDWKISKGFKGRKEFVGKVLKCIGICLCEKREGVSASRRMTNLYETNEVKTEKDSYTWIFLIDGTMVRLSPNSSITFNEINLATKNIFIYARINYGHVLWLSRKNYTEPNYLTENNQKLRETDAMFVNIPWISELKTIEKQLEISDNKIYDNFFIKHGSKKRYDMLNKYLKINSTWLKSKSTLAFVTLPNMLTINFNPVFETIVLLGNKTYFKNKKKQFYNVEENKKKQFFAYKMALKIDNKKITKQDLFHMDPDIWYELDFLGKNLKEVENGEKKFGMMELITRRIPTVLAAREILINKYFKPVYQTLENPKKLYNKFGYRRWENLQKNSDMLKRHNFLINFVRKLERANLMVYDQFIEESRKTDYPVEITKFDNSFFELALIKYSNEKKAHYWQVGKGSKKVINSTKRKFWRQIHEE